ncbi:hypothetical protein BKA66DRAFT_476703 [Pyrenochaeta sp. MPI-SDFR-AT-0127]|nr:hypothetical protein BKA66DRAFT_476703 [Pyrenochaeta sp. MPI-SDFR-AT-0127]
MAHRKRNNENAALEVSKPPTKRQRKAPQVFEKGVNPPPLTPPSTIRRQPRIQYQSSQQNNRNSGRGNASSQPARTSTAPRASPSPLFEPSQLAIDAQTDDILDIAEDDDVEEEDDPVPEDAGETAAAAATVVSDAAGVVGENSPIAATGHEPAAASPEEFSEEPKLHIRWRACWGDMEKNTIPSASNSARNKELYTVREERLWRWADEVVESQKPRGAKIESLTATLYYSRQAKRDRCTKSIRRRCITADDGFELGNWGELLALAEEIDKESTEVLNCDFDLVLREQQPAGAPQPALQLVGRAAARSRPGIVTAIQEDGLAGVVAAERAATGVAMGIRDYWRCHEECCSNYGFTCWMQRTAGRLPRFEDHYKVSGRIVANWAQAVEREDCTIKEPADEIRLSIMMARDRADAEKKRAKRRTSPASSNSSLEGLAKAVLINTLAQQAQQKHYCGGGSRDEGSLQSRPYWKLSSMQQASNLQALLALLGLAPS